MTQTRPDPQKSPIPRYLPFALSATALTLAVLHLSDIFKLDEIGLGLILLATLPWLIPLLRNHVRTLELPFGKVDFLEQRIEKQEERISDQQETIERQQDTINQLVLYSMSYWIFELLSGLYHQTQDGGEYLFRDDGTMDKDLRFLRDRGYLTLDFQVGSLQNGQNLVGVVKLTPAGNHFVELREKFERESHLKK
ncbi:hypothetical protein [Roseiconus lacunae]|uniref:Uncharacterized protein n=1 Tax=Roseiconus lacunae TaxID=2605694 RepID=A0ABT7PS60_9BACT|nr:hypothetical protein [Roseiconus lacunae]MDM4019338.1 hypothetical protein [Roseiconus lacunae]